MINCYSWALVVLAALSDEFSTRMHPKDLHRACECTAPRCRQCRDDDHKLLLIWLSNAVKMPQRALSVRVLPSLQACAAFDAQLAVHNSARCYIDRETS
jgi:hypothetical protein